MNKNTALSLIFLLLVIYFLSSCASIDKSLSIAGVNVQAQGQYDEGRPEMESVCKGFILTAGQVIDFYTTAALVNDESISKKYDILPCYTSGTAYLYGIKYNWRIRSGGFGEFYNKEKQILKVCGAKCCEKMVGIC